LNKNSQNLNKNSLLFGHTFALNHKLIKMTIHYFSVTIPLLFGHNFGDNLLKIKDLIFLPMALKYITIYKGEGMGRKEDFKGHISAVWQNFSFLLLFSLLITQMTYFFNLKTDNFFNKNISFRLRSC
jgi:hypothetical protein